MESDYKIIIKKWNEYNFRKGIRASSWFRMEHDFFENPNFHSFSAAERCTWVYLLCLYSKKRTSDTTAYITVDKESFYRRTGLDKNVLDQTVKKLKQLRIIELRTSRGCYASDANAFPTQQDITIHNNTIHNNTGNFGSEDPHLADAKVHESFRLVEVWNQHCGTLSRAQKINLKTKAGQKRARLLRERWRENPDAEFWTDIVKKVAASEFCNGGRDRTGWRATFDWLLKPDTYLKILEGNYNSGKNHKPVEIFYNEQH